MVDNRLIIKFEDISIDDVSLVGGKNASLGEMITQLSDQGVRVPTGFAVTAHAYRYYVDYNRLQERINESMKQLHDIQDISMLQKVGAEIRALFLAGTVPDDLRQEIIKAYHDLSRIYGQENCDVAVRSSATAEDLPHASFAGQQETFLHVSGDELLMTSYIKCLASLFTDRAIIYRMEQEFDYTHVALSVGVQKMIRSDLASSGVAFSLDTETGFSDVVMIEASYGLGEAIVQGAVTPDEFIVHKPTLAHDFASIIKKKLGDKKIKLVYAHAGTQQVIQEPVSAVDQKRFCVSDDDILTIARHVVIIERYYSERAKRFFPVDVEWAQDGNDGLIYIIQARPETIFGARPTVTIQQYRLRSDNGNESVRSPLITGQAVGQKIVAGIARVIQDAAQMSRVQAGDIIVTDMTDPDWVPVMKRAAGIITNRGGRTCHAAIVSRELGIPALVGTSNATAVIKEGQSITIDCSGGNTGFVYDGIIPFTVEQFTLHEIPVIPTDIMINIADPDSAFSLSFLPTQGVGLARLEFIITNAIKVHPMALLHEEKIEDGAIRKTIEDLTVGYSDKAAFFVDTLASAIACIAAAFYPRPVIVRTSDFKTNEYRNLIGGIYFEPQEENPMLGFRGASRYYDPRYREAFALECAALKKVRETMGLMNVKIMLPFVRTVPEAQQVLDEMKRNGLERGKNGLQIIMMCEIPSNVMLIDQFSHFFDGFSIGSNDLTQLVLGVDRDSSQLIGLFDERDPAVKKMITLAIEGAHRNERSIGVCGQAPSDYLEFAQFLIDQSIDSISLNADSVVPFLMQYAKK